MSAALSGDVLRICRDEDCPKCGWPETYAEGPAATGPVVVGCRKCGWTASVIPRLSEGSAVVIVRGKHRNEPGIVVGLYSNGPGGRRQTVDVLLGRTGERVTVLRTSVEVFA